MPAKAEKPKSLAEVISAYVKEHVVLGKWSDPTEDVCQAC